MARGEMVRFMAEQKVESVEELKKIEGLDFKFCKELSGEKEYVFLRKKEKK